MSYTVSQNSLKSVSLNETDTVKSVLQNVAIILSTWKGSVPLYRDFGISADIMHKPINVAKSMLIADIKEAIGDCEPRAEVISISFEVDPSDPSKLIPTVEVEING